MAVTFDCSGYSEVLPRVLHKQQMTEQVHEWPHVKHLHSSNLRQGEREGEREGGIEGGRGKGGREGEGGKEREGGKDGGGEAGREGGGEGMREGRGREVRM